ncbi:very short patch repair endonuclease [Pontiella agarivorans]|uniref:Very short patch repair endonuclease n=1 Tax=Pontiella agarivorans TaxID=3038953 RepID=A0ABU5MVQ4_9BACT|nr:very short patch repair endonuclease [Pontiella agarivorans]MDZ8118198.1 very short patch repair endonuclease [Pontiella agarivorans]
MDHLTPEQRSENMRRIKGKHTKPELFVRSLLHQAGYRFTVNGPKNRKLPGKPDIVLPKYKAVIFVHGCFWHRHPGCKGSTTPKTRTEWWQAKFDRNVSNDRKNQKRLKEMGWNVVVVWECELRNPQKVIRKLTRCLSALFWEPPPS